MGNYVVGGFFADYGCSLQNGEKDRFFNGKFSLIWEYKQASLHKMQFRKWFLWTTRIRSLNDPERKGGNEI